MILKGEMKFVKDIIESLGFRALAIDAGVVGRPFFNPDVSRDKVAEAGGMSFRELNPSREVAGPLNESWGFETNRGDG